LSDKNDRRSQKTITALGDALLDLMMEKGYEAISIKEIIDRANVGRSTFYSHYPDKDALLLSQLDRVVEFLSQNQPQHTSDGNLYFPSLGLFQHIQEQYKLFRILAWDSGINLVTRHLQKSLSEQVERRLVESGQVHEIPVPVIASFMAGSFLALVRWWLDNKMIYPPEEMDRMFRKLALPGIMPKDVEKTAT
jgi:AcrR family transcriptional regulator